MLDEMFVSNSRSSRGSLVVNMKFFCKDSKKHRKLVQLGSERVSVLYLCHIAHKKPMPTSNKNKTFIFCWN